MIFCSIFQVHCDHGAKCRRMCLLRGRPTRSVPVPVDLCTAIFQVLCGHCRVCLLLWTRQMCGRLRTASSRRCCGKLQVCLTAVTDHLAKMFHFFLPCTIFCVAHFSNQSLTEPAERYHCAISTNLVYQCSNMVCQTEVMCNDSYTSHVRSMRVSPGVNSY